MQLFHNRPFIWHIWDGLNDGFSALVNYHALDTAGLEKLIYTYLGSWIATQKAEQEAGIAGAEDYSAATKLQRKLKEIHEAKTPMIFMCAGSNSMSNLLAGNLI